MTDELDNHTLSNARADVLRKLRALMKRIHEATAGEELARELLSRRKLLLELHDIDFILAGEVSSQMERNYNSLTKITLGLENQHHRTLAEGIEIRKMLAWEAYVKEAKALRQEMAELEQKKK